MIELKALNPHWLDSFEQPEYDLCVHSAVRLKIGEIVVSDKDSGDWTVSTSAYQFLRTLTGNHFAAEHEQLLPCCGFNYWPSDDGFIFGNCGTGLNWDIVHSGENVTHRFDSKREVTLNMEDWRTAVLPFVDEVLEFYEMSVPRRFSDEEAKTEFEYFFGKLKSLRFEREQLK